MRIKFILLTFLTSLTFMKINAQQVMIGFGPEVSLPSGSSSNVSAVGLGGYLKAEVAISEKLAFTANGNIISFFGKKIFRAKTPTITYIPVKAGLKYYTSSEFYFEGQMGFSSAINGKTGTSFAWSPGLGTYLNKKGADHKIDLGLRYESWTRTGFDFVALRVGYQFGL